MPAAIASVIRRVLWTLKHFRCRCIVDCGETLRQSGNGEIVWRRSAAQAAAGPRPWGRNVGATGRALLGERAVGMEDLRATEAQRADGAGQAAARHGRQSHRRSRAAVARLGAGPARSDAGRVTAEAGEGSPSAGQHRTAVAGAATDGSAAKKKSLYASERDTEANQQRRQAFQQTIGRIAPERLDFSG